MTDPTTTDGAARPVEAHVHDLSISIGATDVPEDLMPYLAAELLARAQALVDDWARDAYADLDEEVGDRLALLDVRAEIDDGRRGCHLPHTPPRVR